MINTKLRSINFNASSFDEERHNKIIEILDNYQTMWKEKFKAYAESLWNANACTWHKKYQKVMIDEKTMLCCKASDAEENNVNATNNNAGLDLFARVCKIDN